jgi:hypothetical protein
VITKVNKEKREKEGEQDKRGLLGEIVWPEG